MENLSNDEIQQRRKTHTPPRNESSQLCFRFPLSVLFLCFPFEFPPPPSCLHSPPRSPLALQEENFKVRALLQLQALVKKQKGNSPGTPSNLDPCYPDTSVIEQPAERGKRPGTLLPAPSSLQEEIRLVSWEPSDTLSIYPLLQPVRTARTVSVAAALTLALAPVLVLVSLQNVPITIPPAVATAFPSTFFFPPFTLL